MPRIAEVTAGEGKLNPSAVGTAAWETAGRRLGPLFDKVASADRAQGEIAARTLKDSLWPIDIAKLQEAEQKRQGGPFEGVRLRVTGINNTFGGPTETFS